MKKEFHLIPTKTHAHVAPSAAHGEREGERDTDIHKEKRKRRERGERRDGRLNCKSVLCARLFMYERERARESKCVHVSKEIHSPITVHVCVCACMQKD